MKIKVTEIEADATDLRASNSLSEGLSSVLRSAVQCLVVGYDGQTEDETEEDKNAENTE